MDLLTEFSTSVSDVTLFYQIVQMEGSFYVWIGTEAGQMDQLMAAFKSRVADTPSLTTLIGPADNIFSSLTERLQIRTGKNLFLSVNIPDEALSSRVEEELVSHMSSI